MPLKTSDEVLFEKAITEKKLRDCSFDEFRDLLKYILMVIGLRPVNYPVDAEKQFLYGYITKNFGGHSKSEIRLAFDMAILRKLDLDDDEIHCYENFTVEYFSRIISAYRKWAVKTLPTVSPKPEEKKVPVHEIETEYCYAKLKAMDKGPCKLFV